MNGALVVDKPAGPTSHQVVARVRRAIGVTRVGHTGTLDPLATGVLALLVGRATRLAQFLAVDDKEYLAAVRLGRATATYDAEDRLVRAADGAIALREAESPPLTLAAEDVRRALKGFTGTFLQTPPPFSAKKVGGTAAYRLARRRQPVDIEPVRVTVHELELLRFAGTLAELRIVSSSGFYVRSLAHDLGTRLGCGGHLERLQRTRAGQFRLSQAPPLATIEEEGAAALTRLIPMGALLTGLPQVVVTDRGARRTSHGNRLGPEDFERPVPAGAEGPVRVMDRNGMLLAIGEPAGGSLHPVVVLM